MTEQEYIDSTNLAKLRTAEKILHDALPMRSEEEAFQKDACAAIGKWISFLETVVAIASENP